MTDLEVIASIRRRMTGIEAELAVDPACTAVQWTWAMTEYAKEIAATFAMPAAAPPVNRDVPMIAGTGAVGESLSCTLGNWDNEPTDYAFAWQRDGEPVGSNAITYRVDTMDVGHSITCVVTAINARGSVAAPPSNAIAVAAAVGTAQAAAAAAPARPRETPRPNVA